MMRRKAAVGGVFLSFLYYLNFLNKKEFLFVENEFWLVFFITFFVVLLK